MAKHVLVTGGNSGIGLALCKLLARDHGCHVFLGSRNAEKGANALASIVSSCPETKGKIDVVQIDVEDQKSCDDAAAFIKAKDVVLYAVVNNAGRGLAHGDVGGAESIINTNYLGPKRVSGAMHPLVDPKNGRIVNTSSGAASMWLRDQDAAVQAIFSDANADLTQEGLDAAVQQQLKEANFLKWGKGYGLSKAALTALTVVQAKIHPNLKCVSLSPGFIDTPMTKGFGAKLSPEQGCVSALKCLFGDVTSGHYYGSDGLRSPLTCTRDPGTPEYEGEPNPDPKKYNK